MKKAKTFSAPVNRVFTQVKAYLKANAFEYFKSLDPKLKPSDVKVLTGVSNSQQQAIDE